MHMFKTSIQLMWTILLGFVVTVLTFITPKTIFAEANFNDGMFVVQYKQERILNSIQPQYIFNQPFWYEFSPTDIQSIHQSHPNTKVIRYRSGIEVFDSTINDDSTWQDDFMKRQNSAADWSDILNKHNDWFLKDINNKYINRKQDTGDILSSGSYLIDPGNSGYQEWLFNWIKERLTVGKFDGIYLDLLYPAFPGGNYSGPLKKSDQDAWQLKVLSLVQYIQSHKQQIPAIADKILIINGVGWGGTNFMSNNGLQYITDTQTDGVQYEAFLIDSKDEISWKRDVDVLTSLSSLYSNSMRGWVNAKFDNGTEEFHKKNAVFVLCSYLLGNNSPNFAYRYWGGIEGRSKWEASLEMNFNFMIGSPIELMKKIPGDIYRRIFANGIVTVNPTTKKQSFIVYNYRTDPVLGHTYSWGETINMEPQTGIVLLRTSSSSPPPLPVQIQGDFNSDGKVNKTDISIFTYEFKKIGAPGWILADIDKNGKVDIFDYNVMFGSVAISL